MKFIFIVFLFIISACKEFSSSSGNSPEDIIAHVTYLRNDVKRRFNRRIDWNNIKLENKIFQKDAIRTLNDSEAKVQFKDGSELIIGENSLIILERPELIQDDIDTKITLKEGTFNRVFQKGAKKFKSVVTTDNTTTYISANKSKIGFQYDKKKKLKIAVYSGETQIKTVINKPKITKQADTTKESENITNKNVLSKSEQQLKQLKKALPSALPADNIEVAVYGKSKAKVKVIKEGETNKAVNTKKGQAKDIKDKEDDFIVMEKNDYLKITPAISNIKLKPIKNKSSVDILYDNFDLKSTNALKVLEPKDKIDESIDTKEADRKLLKPMKITKMKIKKPKLRPKPKLKVASIKPKKPIRKVIPKKKKGPASFTKNPMLKGPQFITLEWKGQHGINEYFIDISKTKYFNAIIKTSLAQGNSFKIDIKKLKPGTYFWRVAPKKGKQLFEYRRSKQFTIK